MNPILYEINERRFDTYGLGELDCIQAQTYTERNGVYELYLEVVPESELAEKLERKMKIKADAGTRRKNQTFVIDRVVKTENMVQVFAEHITQTTRDMQLRPSITVNELDAEMALHLWRDNIIEGARFSVWSDITTKNSTSWNVGSINNAREALGGARGSILDVWGGEYEFDNMSVRLHKQLGRTMPTILEYGRNITHIEEDQLPNYTSIYPYAKYREGDRDLAVTLDELVLHSEYAMAYLEEDRVIKPVDFSSHFDEEEEPSQEKLRSLAERYLKNNRVGIPKIKTKVEYVDLAKTLEYEEYAVIEEVDLCDILPVFYPKLGIEDERVKVVAVTYDVLLEQNTDVTVGTIGDGFSTGLVGGVSDRLEALEDKQNRLEWEVPFLENALGNRIWMETKPDENMEHKKGDVWFEKNGKYFIMHIYDGEQWIRILNTEDMEEFTRQIDEMEAKAEELRKQMEEANKRAEEILKDIPSVEEVLDLLPEIDEILEMVPKLEEFENSIPEVQEFLDTIPDLEDLRDQFRRVDNNSEMIAQIIGEEGMLTYSKNWVDTKIDTSQPIIISMEDGQFCFVPSMGKLKVGEPVTISGYREIDYYDNSQVVVNFKEPARLSSTVTVNFKDPIIKQSKVVARFEEI